MKRLGSNRQRRAHTPSENSRGERPYTRASSPSSARWKGAVCALAIGIAWSCSAGTKSPTQPSDPGPFTIGSEAGGANQVGGAVVAELQLSAPNSSSFVLHGTLPVPKGTFPRADGKLPLSIRDSSGFVVPTQIEIVSRYPDDADGADVIEVIGRVTLPQGAAAGSKISYEVVDHLHGVTKLPIKKDVLQLLTRDSSVLVVATDVFGNEYRFDPFDGIRDTPAQNSVKTLRQGAAAVEMRTYGVMHPTGTNLGAPTGALPHFLGVHAYTTAWALEDFVSLDLRVNNGASGADKSGAMRDDDPLGDVYFQKIEVWVPSGWQLLSDVNDPCLGAAHSQGAWTAYPIVKPNADGTMHLMPAQAQFHRRLALAKSAAAPQARLVLDDATLGFCRRGQSAQGTTLWSWWNPQTARYFPQKHALPDLAHLGQNSLQGNVSGVYSTIKGHLENGTFGNYPYSLPNYGWAHPYGVKYGGMTSGSEIWFYDGFKTAEASSKEGYRAYELTHRMYTERQPQVLYNKDGEHTSLEQWLIQTPTITWFPANFFQGLLNGSNDPFGINVSLAYQRTYVAQNNLKPTYDADLQGTSPIDFQHYIRFLRSPMVLTFLGNDSIAKDDLRMASEIYRMSYHEYYVNGAGGTIPSLLRVDLDHVATSPGKGIAFGRGESWGIVSAVAAYNISDPAWRARYRPWFGQIADMLSAGQSSCNGFLQAIVNTKMLNGQFKSRQSIEQAITENMLWGLKESVFRDVDPTRVANVEQILIDSTYAMIGPMAWTANGPWSHLAVAPLTGSTPYCGSVPTGGTGNGLDNYQNPSSYAYGYELTGDATFLTRAAQAQAGGAANLLNALKGQNYNNLENRAALMAVLQ